MSYTTNFRLLFILLAATVSYPMAASKSGKIRYAIGEERNIIHQNGKEVKASIGGKVKEQDKIRTGIEAQVVVALPDGSTISVEENSLVEFSNLHSENGVQTAMTDVKQGKVRFDAQKQTSSSTLKFKTGTATSAIRGTEGIVAITNKGFGLFGLNRGLMDVEDKCGAKGSVTAGELLVIHMNHDCGFKKIKSKYAGDSKFVDEVMNIVDESSISEEKLQKMLNDLDKAVEAIVAQKQQSMSCVAAQVADTVSENKLPVSITCKSAPKKLIVNGSEIGSNQTTFSETLDWAPNSIGLKHFDITCIDTVNVIPSATSLGIDTNSIPEKFKNLPINVQCGSVETYYYNAEIDSINKAAITAEEAIGNFEVLVDDKDLCTNGIITVSGTIDNKTNNPIKLSIGHDMNSALYSIQMPASEKTFSYSFTVNDQNKSWNIKNILVSAGSSKKEIPVTINKSCKSINTQAPIVGFTGQNTQLCKARFFVSNNKNDEGIVELYRDNELVKGYNFKDDFNADFRTMLGTHTYKIVAKDQANNERSIHENISCYDNGNNVYLTIDGERSHNKRYRTPPPPRGLKTPIYKTVHFKIHGLAKNDPSQIESITVTKKGSSGNILYLTNNSKDGIDRLDYDVQMELERGKQNVLTVKVKLFSGKIIENTATYEVR